MSQQRTFEDRPAVRERVPLLVGLVGPSGSGKTKSALRLAEGFRQVFGGEIFGIDTEARRMAHYADQHQFRHVEFKSPFGPLDYLAAIRHCAAKGAATVIIDSMSHVWEGPGGVLESHNSECERLIAAWKSTRDKVQMTAWQRPKAALRLLINEILQLQLNLIFCFRAKEKIKVVTGKPPQQLGYMPIAPDEMFFEMTLSCLLYPASGGVPTWHSSEMGEKAVIKLPQQFKEVFAEKQPLSEDIGRQLAEWARGGAQAPDQPPTEDPVLLAGREAASRGTESLRSWFESLTPRNRKRIEKAKDDELKPAAILADAAKRTPEPTYEPGDAHDTGSWTEPASFEFPPAQEDRL